MNKEDKRKREEGHPLRGTGGVVQNCNSKITTCRFNLLVKNFNEAVLTREIVDAVTHTVIEGQCIKHKQDFNNFLEPGSGEGSSDDSVDPNLCD